ncbi:hypothetical protein QYH69_11800 [Paraburkholderia sp. SARCC-3016]|uniref:hypothetical protein n=1 Tax=Paraburkholderia sp. SARCC-3016 TaxID=3058611 RepID=UPI002809D00F|nr:hypothetical protein [Paraburkholderia sp. SARCC-3016]MDQ7977924.1 hypothetical protein [Paraburkholderia sp. SARCC-3016]
MNTSSLRFPHAKRTASCLAAAAAVTLASCGGSFCVGVNGCTGSNTLPGVSVSGTAATGRALASANVVASCAQGSGSALSDGGGNYRLDLNAALPCIITVTSGSTTLHSVAYSNGTFNTTPETDLMLVYLAAQLGTNENGLIAGFQTNGTFQQALANQNNVLAAQTAVVTNLQQRYAVTLAAPAFLTTPFVVGQPGVDSDLDALATAGAIDANGMPDPAAVSLLTTAGSSRPLGQ